MAAERASFAVVFSAGVPDVSRAPRRFPATLPRRAVLAGLAGSLAAPALGQSAWPQARPIRLIVPFGTGGSTDVIARILAERVGAAIGQTIVVENRPGAGSTTGTAVVAQADPDGYTLLITVISALSVGTTLYRGRIDWHPDTSFAHIAMVLRTPYALMANPRAPFTDFAGYIAAARRDRGLAYGTSGVGSIPHLVMLRLARAAGVELEHIAYRGGGAAVTDAIAGTIPVVLDGLAAAVPILRAGTLRPLAMTSPARLPDFPNVPTFVESGFPDLAIEGWAGLAAPARTPRPVLERLAAATRAAMAEPEVTARYRQASSMPGELFLDDMQAFVRRDAATWAPIVEASGARVE
jgi:tripartite-type tricarboxylate transporter receptor subunit TctC